MSETGVGYLKIRATSAGGALPVSDALVTVSEYAESGTGEIIYSLRTNEGGLTEAVALSTIPASDSMKPEAARPYALYNIVVKKDGYYPIEGIAVPIFDKIVAVQPINMVPITEEEQIAGATNDMIMIYETPNNPLATEGGSEEDIGNGNGSVSGRGSVNGAGGGT